MFRDFYKVYVSVFMFCAVSGVSGCGGHTKGFAPQPPQYDLSSVSGNDLYAQADAASLASISPASGMAADVGGLSETRHGLRQEEQGLNCSIKDRFDRKELIAYEWGQNRLGFDVDGIGYDSMEIERIKIKYRLRLQDYKNRKERCRRGTSWQGLLGTAYNELVTHEGEEIVKKWDALKTDIKEGMEYFVD